MVTNTIAPEFASLKSLQELREASSKKKDQVQKTEASVKTLEVQKEDQDEAQTDQTEKDGGNFPTYNQYVESPIETEETIANMQSARSQGGVFDLTPQQILDDIKTDMNVEERLIAKSTEGGDNLMAYLRDRIDQAKQQTDSEKSLSPNRGNSALSNMDANEEFASQAMNTSGEAVDRHTAMKTVVGVEQSTPTDAYAAIPGLSKTEPGRNRLSDTLVTTNMLGSSSSILREGLDQMNEQLERRAALSITSSSEDQLTVPSLNDGDSIDVRTENLEKSTALKEQLGYSTRSPSDTYEEMPGLSVNPNDSDFGDSLVTNNKLGSSPELVTEALEDLRSQIANRSANTLGGKMQSPAGDKVVGGSDIDVRRKLQEEQSDSTKDAQMEQQRSVANGDVQSYTSEADVKGSGRNPMAVFMSMYG
jgi:hypothetical protein